ALSDHYICRFDVAMRDPLAVRFVQGVRNLTSDLDNFADLQRMAVDPGRERLPFDVLHRDEVHTIRLANLIYRRHVRMIQRARGLGFADKAPHRLRARRDFGGKNLQAYRTAEPGVTRAVNLTHPAHAEP